jgi:hypothetical protein
MAGVAEGAGEGGWVRKWVVMNENDVVWNAGKQAGGDGMRD